MKRSVTIMIFVALAAALFGGPRINPAADPHHPIYDDFDRWLAQGDITEEPAFRPYPQDVIERLLRQVERYGSRSEATRAGRYLQTLSARDAAAPHRRRPAQTAALKTRTSPRAPAEDQTPSRWAGCSGFS